MLEDGTMGIALNVESNNVGAVLMGDGLTIQEGISVKAMVYGIIANFLIVVILLSLIGIEIKKEKMQREEK